MATDPARHPREDIVDLVVEGATSLIRRASHDIVAS